MKTVNSALTGYRLRQLPDHARYALVEKGIPMRSSALAWLLLAASVLAEVLGTVALRYADGFTRVLPSLLCAALYGLAIWLMSLSVRQLDVGLAYAVWAGMGTALTAGLGMLLFAEPVHALRLAGIGLIVTGVAVLNLSTA